MIISFMSIPKVHTGPKLGLLPATGDPGKVPGKVCPVPSDNCAMYIISGVPIVCLVCLIFPVCPRCAQNVYLDMLSSRCRSNHFCLHHLLLLVEEKNLVGLDGSVYDDTQPHEQQLGVNPSFQQTHSLNYIFLFIFT